MILENLVQFAENERLLENADYEPRSVAWIISIDKCGELREVVSTDRGSIQSKRRVPVFLIPRRTGRSGTAPPADFLVDNAEFVFGVEPSGKRDQQSLRQRQASFRGVIHQAHVETGLPALASVLSFLDSDEQRQRALTQIATLGYAINDLFAFKVENNLLHELPGLVAYFNSLRRRLGANLSQCLICGMNGAAVDKHPSIKLPGGTARGVSLVSFNAPAFESFGFERNENAPVCRHCADAYTTALNRLLSLTYPDPERSGRALPRRFVRLSTHTTAVFWTSSESPMIDLITQLLQHPKVDRLETVLNNFRIDPVLARNRFYCLVLSGAQGRAVVRGIYVGPLAATVVNMKRYISSVEVVGSDGPLSIETFLKEIVYEGKLELLPSALQADILLAILSGGKYPRTLLSRVVERCRATQNISSHRASILRSYLNRNHGLELSVYLDLKNINSAYRLGRLMAVLERVHAAAQGNPNRTIVDRYYGSASTRPATVFPCLLRAAKCHLSELSRPLNQYYQSQIEEIVDDIVKVPKALTLQEQAHFALGYYHQRSNRKASNQTSELRSSKGEPTE